jgi:adenosylcobinamide-phosphate synthase
MEPAVVLILAFVLDALLGEPSWLPHPVRVIGVVIDKGEQWLRRGPSSPARDFWGGCGIVLGVVAATFCGAAWLLHTLTGLSWWLGHSIAVLLGSLCLARRSLKEHAQAVLRPLCRGDLETARTLLARIVSRETADLPETEIVRGTVESVAENTSDGVIAPLLYLVLGGVPLALAYKAVNTLDSMLGYRTGRYEYLGKAAARLDDLANFVPARLTALALVGAAWVLSRHDTAYGGRNAWYVTWRDGRKHASPNSGYPEAAVAGALGVQLGGPSRYFGKLIEKPTLGDALQSLRPEHITRSLRLLDTASTIALLACVAAVLPQ